MSEARQRALAAAERRRDIYSGSGQKLGGGKDPLPGGLGIREKIAAATERRIRDSQTCGAGSGAGDRGAIEEEAERTIRAGTVTVGEEQEEEEEEEEEEEAEQEVIMLDEDPENEAAIINAAIELIQEAEREEAEQKLLWEERGGMVWIVDDDDGPIQAELPPTATATTAPSPPSPRIPAPIIIPSSSPPLPPAEPQDLPPSYEQATTWACDLCTLVNPSILPRCEACSFERPDDIDSATSPPPTPLSPIYQNPPLSQAVIAGKEKERDRQKVRFVDMPLTVPEKSGEAAATSGWRCAGCGAGNGDAWWGCGGCGMIRGEI